MNDLFSLDIIKLDLKDADVTYYPNFIELDEAHNYFNHLLNHTPWQQDSITVFGKTHKQPRLTALYGNNEKAYSYSNITMQPHKFSDQLLTMKSKIDSLCDIYFTTCLLNLYRDGNDSNGWHSDNEPELGKKPIIASVSLGEERYFHFKNKNNKTLKHKILLKHGSLLLMKGNTQQNWFHQVPKTRRLKKERINLTFRIIN